MSESRHLHSVLFAAPFAAPAHVKLYAANSSADNGRGFTGSLRFTGAHTDGVPGLGQTTMK